MAGPPRKVTITPGFFPAAEHLLPRLDISARQHEELRAFALQAAADTVRDGPTWGRSNVDAALARGWRILSAKPTGCLLIKRRSGRASGSGSGSAAGSPTVGAAPTPADKLPTGRSPPATPSVSTVPNSSGGGGGQSLMAHSVLPFALEDVMNTLYNENTSEMRAATRRVYGDYLLDCCILQTLEGATMDDPFWYLGLKWIALRSPMAKLVASREFVLLEHSGTHVDPRTGSRMLYRVLQSVHVRGYGGQDSYFGLTRGHIECAFVYWMEPLPAALPRTPGGAAEPLEMLHVCMKGRLHPKGNLPLGVLYKYIKRFWKSERSVFSTSDTSSSGGASSPEDGNANSKRRRRKKARKKAARPRDRSSKDRVVLLGAPLEMAAVWVPDDARPRCSVCRKKFHVLRRLKHHCRACGEVICRACTFYHALNVRDRRALSRQTLPPSALLSRPASATSADQRPPYARTASSGAGRRTLPSALDRDSSADVDAQVEASLALLGDADEPDGEPAVVTVVTGKVCHRCIHGKSVIVAVRPAEAAAQDSLPAERAMSTHGSLKSLFSTNNSTQLMDDADVDALLRSRGPGEPPSSRQPPTTRHNYERVGSPSGSALGVWRPGQLPQQLDRVAMLKQHRLGERAEPRPRLTDDLPVLLGDVEAGSILGLDESKTFLGSVGTRPSGVSRPSHVASQVDGDAIGAAREQPERHEEEEEEDDDDEEEEEDEDEDDESSVAESSSSATSSLTSSQLRHLMDADGSASSSSRVQLRDRRNTIDELAAVEDPGRLAADEDEEDFEFYPAYATTGSSTLTLASTDKGGDAELDRAFAVWGFDPDCLFELRDDDEEEDAQDTDGSLDGLYGPLSVDSSDGPPAKPEHRRVQIYEGGGETVEGRGATVKGRRETVEGGKQAEVLAALTQVESALADQAALLARLQRQNAGERP